jgi:simple sugar transport system permease protein
MTTTTATAEHAPHSSPLRRRLSDGGRTLLALAGTVAVFAAIIAILGANPWAALQALYDGSIGNKFNLGQTIMITALLSLTGLAAAIPFSARLFNVGGEGQLYAGAIVAAGVALELPATTPHHLFVPIVVLLSILGGSLWAAVPGVLKATVNANEVITSLMMTFIALLLANYAITVVWPQGAVPQTENVPAGALMGNIWTGTLVTSGVIWAVAAVAIAWLVMARMTAGFEIRATGLNRRAAQMNGIRTGRVTIVSFCLGGAFAGLAGAIAVLGINGALVSNFSGSFGYLGIAVALVARLSPAWIIPSAFFFAALRVGSNGLQVETGLSPSVGEALVATVVLLLLATKVIRLYYAEAAD